MATQILYNNIDPFSGIAGTPLISFSDRFIKYGEQWGVVDTITLNGTITGGCNYFSDLINGQNSLIQTFSKDFQSLRITEAGATILNKPYCVIKNVNFADSQYLKLLPFTVEIDCYESGFFSGVYGILEPRNEFNFIQEKDQSIRIEHTLSCRGFNTSSTNSNALQNARNYLDQYSGFQNQVTPYFIQICSGIQPSLITVSENIDRNVGSYAITETYIAEKDFASGVLRYTTDYSSGIQDGLSNLRVNGNVKTAKNYPLSVLRQRYSGFDIFTAAVEAYSGCTQRIDLNPFYIESGITEDQYSRTINFSCGFNNDIASNPYIDYKIDYNADDLTQVTNVNFQGTVKGRGELSQRWNAVQAFAVNYDIFSIVFNDYITNGYPFFLNPSALSQSITKNPYTAEITLGSTYTDKLIPPSGLSFLDYSISVTPSIPRYSAVNLLNGSGNWRISSLGYSNREIVRIDGTATIDPAFPLQTGIQVLQSYINYLNGIYATGTRQVLEDQNISQGQKNIGLDATFNSLMSFEAPSLNF